MNLQEIQVFIEANQTLYEIDFQTISYQNIDYTVLLADGADGYVVFPIHINTSYIIDDSNATQDTKISIADIDGNYMGAICLAKEKIETVAMSFPEYYLAFLVDASREDAETKFYKLKRSYLVIKQSKLVEYITKYKKTSILWGGFYHEDDKVVREPLKQAKNEITCLPNLELPTRFHHDNAQRAIAQPYAFERFLKNYHLLELLFDYKVIQDIADNRNDIKTAGEILYKTYKENEEIKRLLYILENCSNITNIIGKINTIYDFQNLAERIFYQYGKDGNPLSQDLFLETLQNINLFAEISFQVIKNGNITGKLKHQQTNHDTFIIKLTAYWIYRIRSSIAHSKIGEFLLSSDDPEHERFMIEFAEPLLQEVLIQCFAK